MIGANPFRPHDNIAVGFVGLIIGVMMGTIGLLKQG